MANTTSPTKWRIAHSGFANTPFVIFAGELWAEVERFGKREAA
jgi:hypothetical protein